MADHIYGDYHFSDGDLARIIDGTNTAIGELQRLNGQVQAHEQSLIAANQSTSGKIMQQRLAIWNDDFGLTVRDLNELNGRVESLRHTNVRTSTDADGNAGH
jgi:protein tyrosine phosphatase